VAIRRPYSTTSWPSSSRTNCLMNCIGLMLLTSFFVLGFASLAAGPLARRSDRALVGRRWRCHLPVAPRFPERWIVQLDALVGVGVENGRRRHLLVDPIPAMRLLAGDDRLDAIGRGRLIGDRSRNRGDRPPW